MLIGYCRVSTTEQNLDRQIESLKNYGCERIYCDKSTGKNFNRPEYIKLKDALRAGDTLVVHEFDRLGRNKRLTLKEIQYFKENNVRLVALNLPTTQLNTNDNYLSLGNIFRIIKEESNTNNVFLQADLFSIIFNTYTIADSTVNNYCTGLRAINPKYKNYFNEMKNNFEQD